ncbi:MAG TPA: PBP1A family penicillin-binding protein [Acidimicrobiales bacterium]
MRWIIRLVASIVVTTVTLAAGLGLTLVSADTLRTATRSSDPPNVELAPLASRSEIVAADGSVIASLYEEDRVPVELADVPKVVVDAVIATEDHAFFEHDGVSIKGTLRALRANTSSGRVAQGGSTITQQLVKNAVLDNERTYDRKAKEAVLALRIEQEYSKEEILERYLNTVYFGAGAHGVVAAAERFFARPLAELGVAEAALLAGLISSPQTFDPFKHPQRAQARREHVLDRMVALGYVARAEADAAKAVPLPTEVTTRAAQPTDYFTEEVRRQLLADERLGATPQDRFATVFRGGIRVETTFDPALQRAAEQAVVANLPQSPFTAALVAIDPADGAVKALVGGPGFEQAKYNLATQGARQAGSSFKTIALAAWLADGRSPDDVVDATAPCWFERPPPEMIWNVDNYDGGSSEQVVTTLREATVKSSNCAYARLALVLGPEKIAAMAQRLGVGRKVPQVPSIVLGSGEVSPLEMASVYATLAADGVRHSPLFIRRVLGSDGKVLFENAPTSERVLEPNVARTITDVLRGVVDRGTGARARIGRPAAGKTGTAQEWRDAWFAGYTPQLAAAVWMGSPAGQLSMTGVAGVNVTGGSFPAQIWGAFMGTAMAPLPVLDFTPPDVAAWPAPNAIGGLPPGVPLPPGITLPAPPVPPELVPGAPVPPGTVDPNAPAPEPGPAPEPTTTTTERRKGKR